MLIIRTPMTPNRIERIKIPSARTNITTNNGQLQFKIFFPGKKRIGINRRRVIWEVMNAPVNIRSAIEKFGKNIPRKIKIIPSERLIIDPKALMIPLLFFEIKSISGISNIPGLMYFTGMIIVKIEIINPIFVNVYREVQPNLLASSF